MATMLMNDDVHHRNEFSKDLAICSTNIRSFHNQNRPLIR